MADQGQRNWSWRVQEAIAVKDAELEKKISIVIQLKEKLAGQTKAKETEAEMFKKAIAVKDAEMKKKNINCITVGGEAS